MKTTLGKNVCDEVWVGTWNKRLNELRHEGKVWNDWHSVRNEIRSELIEKLYNFTGIYV